MSSRLQILAKWTETTFPEKVVDELKKQLSNLEAPLRILGNGSGTGEMDCNMITQLLKKFKKVSNTVLEPAPEHIAKYKELAVSKDFKGVEWDWRQQTWEEFYRDWQNEGSSNAPFHFISAVHSLYYTEDAEKVLVNMHELLEEGGILLVIVLADDGGFGRLWRRFPMFEDKLQSHVLSDSIKNMLDNHNMKYKVMKQPSQVDISCCFEETNEEGSLVTDFLAHVIKLKDTVTADTYKEFMDYLEGPQCSVKDGDKIMFNNSWVAFAVQKGL